jgi:DNA-directed RNA polymerase subunit M/transcription elongation factor TFIIS
MSIDADAPEIASPVQFCPNCGAAMTVYALPAGSRRDGPRIIECKPCGILKTEVMPRD